jgi:hypothetical protein
MKPVLLQSRTGFFIKSIKSKVYQVKSHLGVTLTRMRIYGLAALARIYACSLGSGGSLRLRSVQRLSVVEVLSAPVLLGCTRSTSASIPHALKLEKKTTLGRVAY